MFRRALLLALIACTGCPDATPPPALAPGPSAPAPVATTPVAPLAPPPLAPPDAPTNPWRTLAVGSVFETRIVTHLEKPTVLDFTTMQRQTLSARDGRFATVRVEVVTNGIASPPQDSQIPLEEPPSALSAAASESVTVPAGTFDCQKSVAESREGELATTTETWTTAGLPLPVKRVVKNANMTSTLELMKVEKK
jgi:hypothetical protein